MPSNINLFVLKDLPHDILSHSVALATTIVFGEPYAVLKTEFFYPIIGGPPVPGKVYEPGECTHHVTWYIVQANVLGQKRG